ncbi:F0F1 ATP synthase subunit delta [Nocardioidaceae bacterium]|nr:F0F1 ATP synthase subunit delta [Nocardioidaceae bacterium]
MAVAPDLRGSSEESLQKLLDDMSGRLGSGQDAASTGDELLSVTRLIRSEVALRRALTDPGLPAEVKQRLVREVVGKDLGEVSREIVAEAVASRWTAGSHLVRAIEELGVHAVVRSADADHDDERVAEELFAVRRALDAEPGLRDAFADRSRSAESKQELVRTLLAGSAADATVRLVEQAVVSDHRSMELALAYYQKVAAASHDRRVATVTVATELTAEESQRLASALSDLYGTGVQVNTIVNPAVLGGVKVEVADDVIDGTVAARLHEAQRLVSR